MNLALHCFACSSALNTTLAGFVAARLRAALAARGAAALVVSGGRTPAGFFRALNHEALDWPRITITLADERCVGDDSQHSNAASVRATLLQGAAAAAHFVPLYLPGETIAETNARLANLPECFDAVVLGMGEDGHTASIFPHSPQREAALADTTGHAALCVQGEAPVRSRITLTARRLLATRCLILHLTGSAKWPVLGRALAARDSQLPVSHFLHAESVERHVYWSC